MQDDQTISYLDLLKQTTLKDQKPSICLVIIVSEISDKAACSSYHQKFVKKYSADNEKITGMLLIFRNSYLHVLEATPKVVNALISDLANNSACKFPGKPLYEENTRILLFSEGLSSQDRRRFPFWSSKVVDSKDDSKPLDWAMMEDQSIDDQISSVCIQILAIGKSLSSLGKVSIQN